MFVSLEMMLNGKVVLITGANGGLGTAVTWAFLKAGARVAGVSGRISREDFDHPLFEPIAKKIESRANADEIVTAVRTKWGRLDALVHLIGGFAGGTPLAGSDIDTVEKMFAINVNPFVHMAQAVLPGMLVQNSGSISAIGSRLALDPKAGLSAYAASKAALVSIVKTVALETRDAGVTANVVLPETMDTPANRKMMPNEDFSKWVKPEQVAALLVHLASDEASEVTGAVVPVYGRAL